MNPVKTQETTDTKLTSEHPVCYQPSSDFLTESEF